MMPTRADGALDQKYFFKGPQHMKAIHTKLRDRLREHGYEATYAVSARSTEHLNSQDYGLAMDKARELSEQAAKDREVLAESRRAAESERLALSDERRKLQSKQEYVEARSHGLDVRQREIDANEDNIEHAWEQIRLRNAEAQARRDEIERLEAERQAEFNEAMFEVTSTMDRVYQMLEDAREIRSKLKVKAMRLRYLLTGTGFSEEQLEARRSVTETVEATVTMMGKESNTVGEETRSIVLPRY